MLADWLSSRDDFSTVGDLLNIRYPHLTRTSKCGGDCCILRGMSNSYGLPRFAATGLASRLIGLAPGLSGGIGFWSGIGGRMAERLGMPTMMRRFARES